MLSSLTKPKSAPVLAAISVMTFFHILLTFPVCAAPNGPPPNDVRELQPGHIPTICTVADGSVSTYGATYGAYWSESAQTWVSAPYCYPRWGYLEASPSQIIAAGDTITVTATPDDARMAGLVAIQGGMGWSYPGERVSGLRNKRHDLYGKNRQ